jgi:hypothetical protein
MHVNVSNESKLSFLKMHHVTQRSPVSALASSWYQVSEDSLADARFLHLHQPDYTGMVAGFWVVGVDLEWKDWIGVEAVEGIECPVP